MRDLPQLTRNNVEVNETAKNNDDKIDVIPIIDSIISQKEITPIK